MDHDSLSHDDQIGGVRIPLYDVGVGEKVTLVRLLGVGGEVSHF